MKILIDIMSSVMLAFGIIALTIFVIVRVAWCVEKVKSLVKRFTNPSIDKIFAKIGKLYDKAGYRCVLYHLFVIPVSGATIDDDANAEKIRLGNPEHRYVYARTTALAKATFLDDNPDYFIIDCCVADKFPKLKYA